MSMGRKERTSIYINGEVKKKANELGLNVSQVCENALKAVIRSVNNTFRIMGQGFEPGSEATQEPMRPRLAYRPVEPGAGVQIPSPALNASAVAPPSACTLPGHLTPAILMKFRRFMTVDLELKPLTIKGHAQAIARLLKWLGDRPVTRDVLRDYLETYKDEAESTYANQLKSLKVFFRDFIGRGDLVTTFKFPSKGFEFPRIPPKEKLQEFLHALLSLDLRIACFFLLYATSGWRRREVMALHREDVDLEGRMMRHRVKASATKGRLIGIFNEEAAALLKRWMDTRTDSSPKLLPITERTFRRLWHQAAEACGFTIQPQMLRDWFCEEMGNLGVRDRYIDAFCGRTPKSVLAKHYTDYLPEKLKRIYDKAGLKVLS